MWGSSSLLLVNDLISHLMIRKMAFPCWCTSDNGKQKHGLFSFYTDINSQQSLLTLLLNRILSNILYHGSGCDKASSCLFVVFKGRIMVEEYKFERSSIVWRKETAPLRELIWLCCENVALMVHGTFSDRPLEDVQSVGLCGCVSRMKTARRRSSNPGCFLDLPDTAGQFECEVEIMSDYRFCKVSEMVGQ